MTNSAIQVLAVEDDFIQQENLRITVEELGYELVGLEDNAQSALQRIEQKQPDVVLLDIHIAGPRDGIALGHQISQQYAIPIIYITSFKDTATFERARQTHPFAYLTKPVDVPALQRSIELAILQLTQADSKELGQWESDVFFRKAFFVKIGQRLVKFLPEEVLWIEVSGNRYCKVVSTQRQAHVRATLVELQEKLAPSPFIRVHRSYLINPHHIDSIFESQQTIQIGEKEIPIGKTYRDQFYRQIRTL